MPADAQQRATSEQAPLALEAVADACTHALVVVRDGQILLANPMAVALLGMSSAAEVVGRELWPLLPEAFRTPARDAAAAVTNGEHAHLVHVEPRVRVSSGRAFDAEVSLSRVMLDDSPAVLVAVRDFAGELSTAAALRSAQQRMAAAFVAAPIGMMLLDSDGVVLDANPAMARLVGRAVGELRGTPAFELVHPGDINGLRTAMWAVDGPDPHAPSEWRIAHPDGAEVWVHVSLARTTEPTSTFVVHVLDVTRRRAADAQLAHRALHDPLTDLPNRTLLLDRLAQAVRQAERGGAGVGVLFVDLDSFKDVNDTRGHAAGDQVLNEVAHRLSGVLRPADTVARLGGDEFAVVVADLSRDETDELADRLREVLASPYDGGVPLAASVGVAHSSSTPLDVDALLSGADTDMYTRKQQARRRPAG